MSDTGESGRRRIGDRDKERFLSAVRRGLRLDNAAGEAGFTLSGFRGVRRRDATFAEGWREALAESAARERFCANNRRRIQKRRMRHVRFDAARKSTFLAQFRGTCDTQAAAAAAGVDKSTVYKHRRRDADFAEEFQAALETGYAELEAEALRQRLEALARLRADNAVAGEIDAEFERMLKLLDRFWRRRDHAVGLRPAGLDKASGWTFAAAIEAIERKLKAIGVPIRDEDDDAGPDGEVEM